MKNKGTKMRSFCRTLPLVLLTFCAQLCFGQISSDSLLSLPDSGKAFTISEFYQLILRGHPVAKQAALLDEFAKQEVRLARGNFDPKLEAQYLEKNFGDTEYYQIFNSGIKFPFVFPFDASVGVEQNSGQYLNPERYISDKFNNRQFYTGVSIPLLRGLITDDRRAALRQAQLFGSMMDAEQVKVINKLLLEAAKDYWNWTTSYYNFRLYNQSVSIAQEIFDRVKINNSLGEAAAIDTVQAKITLQQRLVERQEALLDFQNAGLQLSNYLWDSLSNPLQLPMNAAPVLPRNMIGVTNLELEELVNLARENHPELQKLDVKLRQLEVERKLAAEYLKPRLDASYYFLNQPFDPNWNSSIEIGRDYKLGIDFSFPLFIRKERAKFAHTKLKLSTTEFDRSITERQIVNQVNTSYNQLTNRGVIIRQQSEMVDNYNRLLRAELINLENGESDLFKINIQIEKLIQSQAKLIKLLGEYEKDRAFLYWAAGVTKFDN